MAFGDREHIVLLVVDGRIALATFVDEVGSEFDDSRVPVEPQLDVLLGDAELQFLIEKIFVLGVQGRLDLSLGRSFVLEESWAECANRLLC